MTCASTAARRETTLIPPPTCSRATPVPDERASPPRASSRPQRRMQAWLVALLALAGIGMAQAKVDPTVVLNPIPSDTSTFGTPMNFVILVASPTPGGPQPTGTIYLQRIDADASSHRVCTIAIDTNFLLQTCDYPTGFYPPVATSSFDVFYTGDSNYNGRVSGTPFTSVPYVITKQTPTLTFDPIPPVFAGQQAVIPVHLAAAAPTGFVVATVQGNGQCQFDTTNQQPCTTTSKTTDAGTLPVVASYLGDDNHNSVQATSQMTILPAPTTVTISPYPAINLGATANLDVSVSSVIDPDAKFFGSITVSDGEVSCTGQLVNTVDIACELTPVSAGTRQLTATYSGNSEAAPSSGTGTLLVNGPAVDGVCGSDNGMTLATTPTHLCSVGTPSAITGTGPWSWSCAGSGTGVNAQCSAQKAATGAAATTTTLSLSPNPVGAGSAVLAQVTVSAAAPTGGLPRGSIAATLAAVSGSVNVVGAGTSCIATVANGTGSCTLVPANPGSFSVSAMYAGNTDDAPSTGSATLIVLAAGAAGGVLPAPLLGLGATLGLMLLVVLIAALRAPGRRTRHDSAGHDRLE